VRIRLQLEIRSIGIRYVIPIVIGVVGAVELLLAVLHGIEATIWAAAYLWLGAVDSPIDAMNHLGDPNEFLPTIADCAANSHGAAFACRAGSYPC